jgi:hypothetical protein
MFKKIGFALVMGILIYPSSGFGQAGVSGQERLVQPVIINGQQVQGVMVVENGLVQTHTCSYPQQYVTVDQSSSGWACFEQTTGVWLLHALPPTQAPTQTTYVYQQPPIYVSSPVIPTYPYPYSYGYSPFGYPYGYYPYAYPYFVGPRFGVGVGFGFGFPVGRRPFVVSRSRPVIIGSGRPFVGTRGPFVTSRPSGGFRPAGGFRSAGPGRASGRMGRR